MTSTTSCPSCGAPVADDWRFCMECGTERPGLYEPVSDAVPSLDGDAARASAEPDLVSSEPALDLPGGADVRWKLSDAIVVFFVGLLVTVLVTMIAATIVGPEPSPGEEDVLLAVSLVTNQLTLALTTIWWLRGRFGVGLGALALRKPTGNQIGLGLGAGAIGVVVSALVAGLVALLVEAIQNRPPSDPEQIPLRTDDPSILLLFVLGLSTVVFAPVAEEIFFRGMLHQGARRRYPFRAATIVSSTLFALVHLHPLVIPSIFALAIVLAVVYERSKNLWTPIVAHATFNLVGFTVSFLLPV